MGTTMFFKEKTCLMLIFVCLKWAKSQFVSPCPRQFAYDIAENSPGKWYGTITLQSDTDLNGIWLRVILDKPSLQLGNWFGQVTTADNQEFLIKNRNYGLKAQAAEKVRFYIKYDEGGPIPQVVSIRLNAKSLCPDIATSEAPPFTASITESAVTKTTGAPGSSRPSNSDDDVYPGDFYVPPTLVQNMPDCGTVKHGLPDGEFPWHVALYYVKGIDLVYICSAALFTPNLALSSAHCVTKKQSTTALNPENFMVYLGKHYLRRWTNPGIQDRKVESITIHPSYVQQNFDNDLALIKLVQPAELTDYVRPVCLFDSGEAQKEGKVTGWGFDESGKLSEELVPAVMQLAPFESCISSAQTSGYQFDGKSTFCAAFKSGSAACVGNSGSGFVYPKGKNGGWQLRGIVALNPALQSQRKCDTSQVVVFTEIGKHLEWIKQMVRRLM